MTTKDKPVIFFVAPQPRDAERIDSDTEFITRPVFSLFDSCFQNIQFALQSFIRVEKWPKDLGHAKRDSGTFLIENGKSAPRAFDALIAEVSLEDAYVARAIQLTRELDKPVIGIHSWSLGHHLPGPYRLDVNVRTFAYKEEQDFSKDKPQPDTIRPPYWNKHDTLPPPLSFCALVQNVLNLDLDTSASKSA